VLIVSCISITGLTNPLQTKENHKSSNPIHTILIVISHERNSETILNQWRKAILTVLNIWPWIY